jgi:phage shock protein A
VDDPERRREIVDQALGHVERQLELIRRRRARLGQLEEELTAKHRELSSRLRELSEQPAVSGTGA